MATAAEVTAPFTNLQQKPLSEQEERESLENLIFLRDNVRSNQHPKFKPNATNGYSSSGLEKQNGSGVLPSLATSLDPNGNTINKASDIFRQPMNNGNGNARPIPVFPPALSTVAKGDHSGERAVITVNGKSSPKQNNQIGGRERQDDRRQPEVMQPAQQHAQGQWDNQAWMLPPGQGQGDPNAFPHFPMLPVHFDLPPGIHFPPLPPPGQALSHRLMPLTNHTQSQPDPMVVDNPIETRKPENRDREPPRDQRQTENNSATPSSATNNDFQATVKKAQAVAASLPPKPTSDSKSAPLRGEQTKQPVDKNRNTLQSSPTAASFPNADRREDDRQGYQRQPPRDHRQYNDKRAAEPLRKAAMGNNHNNKDERREREREPFTRERDRERFPERDRRQGGENRNFKNLKRESTSPSYIPNYDDAPPAPKVHAMTYPPSQPSRTTDSLTVARPHDRPKVMEANEGDDNHIDQKRRTNNGKDAPKLPQTVEKKPSPQPPPKREPLPPSPGLAPRGSPTLEPLSPGRGRSNGAAAVQDRYAIPAGAKPPAGYYRYRDYPAPVMGYARSPYEPYEAYAPPPPHPLHVRDPRPVSPRRMYVGTEGRGYAQEYVYQEPYHDPYYPYPPPQPPRRLGTPPPIARGPGPRYRYEDEDPQRPARGRSPSPRAAGRIPVSRQRRPSRSASPPRERAPPRQSAPPAEQSEEPRQERSVAREAPQYAEYPPYHRPTVHYDPYNDPYRQVVVRERYVFVPRVVYVDPNDPEGRPYRPQSPGYSIPAHPTPPPGPPPIRRYVDDPEAMNNRYYRERDYEYGPYDRGYGREYVRDYPPHPQPLPPPVAHVREAYGREYAPPAPREEERTFREREYGAHPHPAHPAHQAHPPPPTPRDVEDARLPYAREARGGPLAQPPPQAPRYP
ncbi:hypothetical protein ABW19_dt0207672 [Dactylella cylindrospora]|nr:hypothetical protein ABW19_dt0207672 [Dactylella cylindrospora]